MLQQIVGSWNTNLGCCDVLWTDCCNRLLRLFSQIVAGIGLVDRFGFRGTGDCGGVTTGKAAAARYMEEWR